MMMTTISHRRQDGYHVDGADCCLISIVLGVTTEKISPNNNISTKIHLYRALVMSVLL